jgi:hypothetical protein
MGYNTDFNGEFKFNKPLDDTTYKELVTLNKTRHEDGHSTKSKFPGIWCHWVPSKDGCSLEWDEGEKFYYYIEWLKYIVKNILEPKGYAISGAVEWCGDEQEDIGLIVAERNEIRVLNGRYVYGDETEIERLQKENKRLHGEIAELLLLDKS